MYIKQYGGGYAVSEIITVVITIVNIVIRTVVILMIKQVGYHTASAETSAIMITVFIATFFNTGILLLLADANTNQIKILSWVPFLNGPFPDLTEDWYIVIAPSLILTMFLNAITPYIEIVVYLIMDAINKGSDQGYSNYMKCKTPKTTKFKTIQSYVSISGGP